MSLAGKTVFITGGSRGIGLAIARRAARDGANIVLAAKTVAPHPTLPGTIYTAATEITSAGGAVLPLEVDIRDEARVTKAMAEAAERFGGIDILVNNASAIKLTGTLDTPVKRYDLMHGVNGRGTFVCAQACLPYLLKAANPHILTLSPPPVLNPAWFRDYPPYAITKYTMSLFTLSLAAEFAEYGVAVNSLWPRTAIATAAIANEVGGLEMMSASRKPEIMADAAHIILTQPSRSVTGRFFLDDEVLLGAGITDFSGYSVEPGHRLQPDLFVDPLPGMLPQA